MSAQPVPLPFDPLKMLYAVSEHGAGVTAWERTFIAQMAEFLERGGELTQSQKQKLEQIAKERLP